MVRQLKLHIMERMLFLIFCYYLFYKFSRVQFEFILNQGTPNEIKYEFTSREPFHGPVEYTKSYLKVNQF